jgi:hypothetical protein
MGVLGLEDGARRPEGTEKVKSTFRLKANDR